MSQNNITYIVQVQDQFSEALRKFGSLIKNSGLDVEKFNKSLDKTSATFSKINKEADKVDKSINKINNSVKKAQSSFSKMGEIGDKFSSKGWGLTKALTLPISAGASFGIKNVAEIEKHMKAVQANASLPIEEYNRLISIKTDVSKRTGVSPLKISEGLEVLSASGIHSVDELKSIIEPALNLSRSSNSHTEETARLLNEVMHSFRINASQATKIADKMSYAMDAAGMNISDLIYGMQYAGPNAFQAGIKLDELTALFMSLARIGKKGSVAGTSVNSLIASIGKDPEKFKKIFESLGISALDANGHFKDVGQMLEGMKELLMVATKAGKETEFFKELKISSTEKDAWIALLSSVKGYKNDLSMLSKKDNFAEYNAKQKTDTLIGSYERLGASISRLTEKLFDKDVIDGIRKFIDGITDFLVSLENKSPAFFKFIRVISTIGIVVGPALIGIGKLLLTLRILSTFLAGSAIISGFGGISTAILSAASSFGVLVAAAAPAIVAIKELSELGRSISSSGGFMNWAKTTGKSLVDSESWGKFGHYVKERGKSLYQGTSSFFGNDFSKQIQESEIKLNVTLDPNLALGQTKENSNNVKLNVNKNIGSFNSFGMPSFSGYN